MDASEHFMTEAFQLAKRAMPEDEEIHPKVGAVIVKDGVILASASRNENERGSHAEYLAIKKARESSVDVRGATVYTTLEPCTHRSPDYLPCSQHIADQGIERVIIGMTDPNPKIENKGIQILIEGGIQVVSGVLDGKIRNLNIAFIEKHKKNGAFAFLEEVLFSFEGEYPQASQLLHSHLEVVRKNQPLKPGDMDHYKEIVSYEEFFGLIDDLNPAEKAAITRAFLFSVERQKGAIYRSEHNLPYAFHTTQVASSVIAFGINDAARIIRGLWHDMVEDRFATGGEMKAELQKYGFSPGEYTPILSDLRLLNRGLYRGTYTDKTRKYYRGIQSSVFALEDKAADIMMNMKRWLMHGEFLIVYKPHLLGKYLYESATYLGTGTPLEMHIPQAVYRLGRIREKLARDLKDEMKERVINASERYGAGVQSSIAHLLFQ